MSYEPVNIYVESIPPAAPVAGVVVKVFNQLGTLVYDQQVTDVDGKASFLLDSGLTSTTYQVRFFKSQFSIKNPFLIEVKPAPEVNDFTVVGESIVPPAATDVRLCTASGYFLKPNGAPAASVDIHFIVRFEPLLLDGKAMLTERVSTRTDKNGYAQVNLVRCARYDVTVAGMEDITRVISVPDAAKCNLPDLLFPVVAAVTFDPPIPSGIALAVDAEMVLTPTVVSSSGEVLQGTALEDVSWRSSDPNVFSVAATATTLTVRGIVAGSAELRAERNDTTILRIPDPPVTGQPITVTVS